MNKLIYAAGVAALGMAVQANAALLLDSSVTSSFMLGGGLDPGNDLPNAPPAVRFGQLKATEDGTVNFYFTGSEAAYANNLRIDGSMYPTTPNFTPPDTLLGSIGVTAGSFVDFGFCTSGGAMVGAYGMCASNTDGASLIAQFNYVDVATSTEGGYRSIGYRALSSYDPTAGLSNAAVSTYAAASVTDSSLWAIFWDDSGARNDDDYDDYIAVARFTPAGFVTPVDVSEPLTLTLLGSSLLGMGVLRRRVAKR